MGAAAAIDRWGGGGGHGGDGRRCAARWLVLLRREPSSGGPSAHAGRPPASHCGTPDARGKETWPLAPPAYKSRCPNGCTAHTHTHDTNTKPKKKGKRWRIGQPHGREKKKPFTQWPSWMTMRSARPAPPPRLAVPPRRRAPATAGQPLPPPPPTKTAPRRRAPAHGRRGNRRTGWRAARWCRGQGQNLEAGPPRGSHMPASVHT